ncbi:MAG: PAS domain S-box protein [Chitinivibrionales bacterium]|nr:PAS domain S-box protein [Chitinivibrionales bacterium]
MNPYAISSLFSAIVMAFLGVFVHIRNSRSTLNRVFMLLCLTMSYWAFTEFQARNAESAARAEFWLTAGLVWPLAIALLWHFVLVFTGRTQRIGRIRRTLFIYAPAVLITVMNGFVSSHQPVQVPWGWTQQVTSSTVETAYYGFAYLWALTMALSSLLLAARFALTAESTQTRKMGKHVAIGLTFVVVPSILTEVLLPALLQEPVIELTVTMCAVMAAFITYAIIKYELFTLSPSAAAQSIVATISDPLFLVDLDHNIRTTNSAACRMLGYEIHELIGHPIGKVFPPSEDGDSNTSFLRAMETGVVNDVETALLTKDGERIPVSLSWSMTRSKDGRTLGVTFIGRDITDRLRFQESLKQARDNLQLQVEEQTKELTVANKMLREEIGERMKAEEELAEDKEYLSVTLRSIADGVITTDRDGSVVLLNRVAEELTGWQLKEAMRRPLLEVLHVIDEETREENADPFDRVAGSGEAVMLSEGAVLLARDGTERTVSYSGAPIRSHTGKIRGMVLVIRDISERRKLEERLFKNRKLESVSVLAAGIAHDFNNILTGIMTSLFVARTQVKPDSETYQLLSEAEQSAFRASSLTKQLLTFAKGTTPVRQRLPVRELIEETVGFCLSGSQADYELDISEDLCDVELDRGQMDQALSSIIVNAEEAMPDGGLIRIRAENRTIGTQHALPVPKGQYVVLSIADQGGGIPEEDLHRVFDPYYTTKPNHNGLGLTTAHSVVTQHEGCIDVESAPGQGAVFYVYLPAAPAQDLDFEREVEDIADSSVARRRVLFMDDEDYIRRTAAKLLEHIGYETITAARGEEVLDLYRESLDESRPFDVVVLDLSVSGGKGARETISELRQLDPEVRAVVTSGYATDPILNDFRRFGFTAALSKPYTVQTIEQAIAKALEDSEV